MVRKSLAHELTSERYVRTIERTRRRRRGTARRVTAITAVTADHSGHDRSGPAMTVTAVTAGHGRTFWTRGLGPGDTNQARTARVRVRTAPSGRDLSTAVTAVVTAAAAPPVSLPGAPGAVSSRSSARSRMDGEPGLRGGDRSGGGNHHPIQGLEVETTPSPPTHDGLRTQGTSDGMRSEGPSASPKADVAGASAQRG